jgi:hypothetical protein
MVSVQIEAVEVPSGINVLQWTHGVRGRRLGSTEAMVQKVGGAGSRVTVVEGTAGRLYASIHGDGSSLGGRWADRFQSASHLGTLPLKCLSPG